ncbi:uncharacterized protein TNCV_1821491 [Trichonephila clavipes]|nr:uncharacterized protein TNCV_1821491 [Trichonephila clavipes]
MINTKKKERFPPEPGTISLRRKDINLITEFEPGDASRDLSFVKKGKFCKKEQRSIVGHCIGFVEVVFSSFSHDELSEILRWLEQIDVSRMVDIDILMQIWKNQVKQIDFVLKWLSRDGSEVRPPKDESEPWESLFRVHNVDLVNSFHELMRRRGRALDGDNLRGTLKKKRALDKKKGETMNANGVGELE